MTRWLLLPLLAWTALAPTLAGEPVDGAESAGFGTVLRGVSKQFEFEHAGCPLRAKPVDHMHAPVSLSIHRADTPGVWKLDVIGVIPGAYDLADFVECANGQPADLSPLPVRVVSALPPGRHIDLIRVPRTQLSIRPGSAAWAIAALGTWIALTVGGLIFLATHRVIREGQPEADTTPTDPHLLLIEAVGVRPMTIPERGRLELLTLRALGRRHLAECPDSPLELYGCLRREPEASSVVEALESWLHHPDTPDHDAGTLRELLEEQFSTRTDENTGGT